MNEIVNRQSEIRNRMVVSTCLFGGPQATRHRTAAGPSEFYRRYLPPWIRAHHNVFGPGGWDLRIHVDDELDEGAYGRELRAMHEDGQLTIVECGPATERNAAMLWRLKPLFEDHRVEVLICRDLDSIPTPRDRACVRAWLADRRTIAHGINDSISHTAPLMGGMCGFRTAETRMELEWIRWEEFIAEARQLPVWATPGSDQSVLQTLMWRRVRPMAMVHVLNGAIGERHYAGQCAGPPAGMTLSDADLLLPHLGASGFDVPRAMEYWQAHGDPEIERRIRACERTCEAASGRPLAAGRRERADE